MRARREEDAPARREAWERSPHFPTWLHKVGVSLVMSRKTGEKSTEPGFLRQIAPCSRHVHMQETTGTDPVPGQSEDIFTMSNRRVKIYSPSGVASHPARTHIPAASPCEGVLACRSPDRVRTGVERRERSGGYRARGPERRGFCSARKVPRRGFSRSGRSTGSAWRASSTTAR